MTSPGDSHEMVRRVQRHRAMKDRDDSLAAFFSQAAKQIKRQQRSVGNLGALWAELAPGPVVDHTSVVSFARGILTIRAADASARFEAHAWLKSGGERQLISRAATALIRVRLV